MAYKREPPATRNGRPSYGCESRTSQTTALLTDSGARLLVIAEP